MAVLSKSNNSPADGDHIHLQNLTLSSGEEGVVEEEVLFIAKAILYSYNPSDKFWEGLGIYTVKIIKHKNTGQRRLLITRGLTVCLDHSAIISDNKFHTQNGCAFMSLHAEIVLALKFRSDGAANKFISTLKNSKAPLEPAAKSGACEETSSDNHFVEETVAHLDLPAEKATETSSEEKGAGNNCAAKPEEADEQTGQSLVEAPDVLVENNVSDGGDRISDVFAMPDPTEVKVEQNGIISKDAEEASNE